VAPPSAETIFAPISAPTSIASDIITNPTTILSVTLTAGALATKDTILVIRVSHVLYNTMASMVMVSMASILMLVFDWQLPPLPFT
jgi:hypothetical protein